MNGVFVYGTLKRGEVRERCWPRTPLAVEVAFVRARLYDLGPYPALAPGDDHVAGELWTFADADLPPTLSVLDRIEGYADQPGDWYVRRIIQCELPGNQVSHAWAYFFARADKLSAAQRVFPAADGVCRWFGGVAAKRDFEERGV